MLNRDSNGLINLDFLSSKDIKQTKDKKIFTFIYNNQKYVFKKNINVIGLYNELIAEEIANQLNIPCAHYDIASYSDYIGVISNYIFNEEDKVIYMNDILKKYNNNIDENELNNLQDIWNALELWYKDYKVVEKLMNQLVDIFIFDILIGNVDRHNENLIIVENNHGINFSKLIDNENMLSSISIYGGGYSLGVEREDFFLNEEDFDYENNFLKKFLNISDNSYLYKLENKLKYISEENIDLIIKRVEKRIEHKIEFGIEKNIKNRFKTNRNMINMQINEYKDRMRIL